jgi:hypothetical protein
MRCGAGFRLFDRFRSGGGLGQEDAGESAAMAPMSPWISFACPDVDHNFRGITQSNHKPSVAALL